MTHNGRDFEGVEEAFGIRVQTPRAFLMRLDERVERHEYIDSLHERARQVAKREGTSMNQLIARALAKNLSALDTVAYLEERGTSGSRNECLRALGRVPSRSPLPGDEPDDETGDPAT